MMFHKSRRLLSLYLLLFFIQFFTLVKAACYFPDGGQAPNDSPCQDNTKDSVCCGQGYACLSNGLCQATGDELKKPNATEYVRGGCTDKSWRSSSCPSFCKDNSPNSGAGVIKCLNTNEDKYWCTTNDPEYNALSCDDPEKRRNVLFFAGSPSAITTIGVSPMTTTSSQESSTISEELQSTSTQSTNPSATPEAKSSSNNGAVIGGAVGGAVAALILAGVGLWWFLKIRKRRIQAEDQSALHSGQYQGSGDWSSKAMPTYEMSAATPPQELPGTPANYHR